MEGPIPEGPVKNAQNVKDALHLLQETRLQKMLKREGRWHSTPETRVGKGDAEYFEPFLLGPTFQSTLTRALLACMISSVVLTDDRQSRTAYGSAPARRRREEEGGRRKDETRHTLSHTLRHTHAHGGERKDAMLDTHSHALNHEEAGCDNGHTLTHTHAHGGWRKDETYTRDTH